MKGKKRGFDGSIEPAYEMQQVESHPTSGPCRVYVITVMRIWYVLQYYIELQHRSAVLLHAWQAPYRMENERSRVGCFAGATLRHLPHNVQGVAAEIRHHLVCRDQGNHRLG